MEAKKSSRSNLENFSKLFMLLGLVLALTVVYVAIEFKSRDQVAAVTNNDDNKMVDEEDIPEIEQKIEEVKPIDAPPPPPVIEEIKVVDDNKNIVETVLETTETTQEDKVVIQEIKEVEVEEEVVEDVPFSIIEDKPQYPGCTGDKDQQSKCLEDNIRDFVFSKFNTELGSELGLSGKQRINVQFTIDKNGNIADVRARAPHKRLETEAIRVVSMLPKMIPGKQRGKPTGVKYNLPITFNIEEQ